MSTNDRDQLTGATNDLEHSLRIAEEQAELCENGWFIARRVKTRTDFPKVPSRDEVLEDTESVSAVPPQRLHNAADEMAALCGYLAHAWNARVTELRELLRDASTNR